jgi:hypothetical protein
MLFGETVTKNMGLRDCFAFPVQSYEVGLVGLIGFCKEVYPSRFYSGTSDTFPDFFPIPSNLVSQCDG